MIKDSNKLTVKCFSNAKFDDINKHIVDMSKNEQQKFETIHIVAGNHDCETDSTLTEVN